MTASQETEATGHARFTYRLRVPSTGLAKLLAEWDRCRWVWNECAARSKRARTEDEKCGPARLDRMLTEARSRNGWLGAGCSVPQQQLVRDFGKSRAKALKDIKARLPLRQRAGMPKFKKKAKADPSLNYKHALPLSERTYSCTACGAVSPRDKNSARVMLVRAGLNPAGADRARADGPPVHSQREPGIPAVQGRGGFKAPPAG
ncbi:hypothetical protein [Streptomyces sp. NBC_01244]|uniref:hypothetical protein n=1 Tax=Streptomyces sp. NBC_01244 TaxID=2903797 RepID=UPI002E0F5D55|nr:hypothetical protein OG247_36255 [Streptomyces sp. NBC_01244]